jgi:MFS family permease
MNLLNPYKGLPRDVYVIFISQTVNALGALIYPFMTLLLSRKIGLSPGDTGMAVSVLGLLYGPASIVGGKLADSFGRKRIIILFESIAVLAYGVCIALEPSLLMVGFLATAALCFGIAGPAHSAMIADLTTEDQREGAYSLLYLGFNLGFAFAQIIGGLLFENHLNMMFLIDAGTALAAILLLAFLVTDVYRPAGAEGSGNHGGSEEPGAAPAADPSEASSSTIAVLLRRPVLLLFALAAFGYRFVYSQWGFMVPLQAGANFGSDGPRLFGLLGSFNAVTVVLLTPLLTALLSRRTNIQRIILGGILFAAGFGLLGYWSTRTAFFVSVFVFTLGEILEAISSMPFIMNHTPASHRGRIAAVVPIIMGLGFAIGPWVMGEVLERSDFTFSWTMAAAVVLIAVVGMTGIARMERRYRSAEVIPSRSSQESRPDGGTE